MSNLEHEQTILVSMVTLMEKGSWQVLLLGGASGTGKSTAAQAIGRHVGGSWLQVDDLRLVLQYGELLTPRDFPDLFYFLQLADVRAVSPETLRDQLIAIARLMTPAIRSVVGHHTMTQKRIILEGDGIAPAAAAEQQSETVRAVFLVVTDEATLQHNMMARGRGVIAHSPETEAQGRAWVQLAWHYNQWLEQEARKYGLPMLSPQPYETLVMRILDAADRD